jgi:hypothetical protein
MDRQHPRDIFDVLLLWEKGGITPGMLDCMVCYLAGHNRPVHEVLFANKRNLESSFSNEFDGMTRKLVRLKDLEDMQAELLISLTRLLTAEQRTFLMGMAKACPDWSLLPVVHLKDLPAIRWKLANLERLKSQNPNKFNQQASQLEQRFSLN